MESGPFDKKISIPKSDLKNYKESKNINNKEIKKNYKSRNKKKIYRLSTISNSIFSNRIKNIKHSNNSSINDSTKLIKNDLYSTISNNNYKSFRMKCRSKYFNDYKSKVNNDKKYGKFVLLLKKQNDKNIKLLNDVKKTRNNE